MRPFAFASLTLLSSAALAEDFTINVGTDERGGVCYVYLPREDGVELALSVRASDSNLNIQVNDIPPEWVDESREIQLTIRPDKGKPVKTDKAGYVAGFQYRAEGWFDEPGKGLALLSALKGGKEFAAEFDKHKLAGFMVQQTSGQIKDYAYTFMKECVERNGGDTSF